MLCFTGNIRGIIKVTLIIQELSFTFTFYSLTLFKKNLPYNMEFCFMVKCVIFVFRQLYGSWSTYKKYDKALNSRRDSGSQERILSHINGT